MSQLAEYSAATLATPEVIADPYPAYVELGGKTIREGDWVACFYGAANRDPAMFEDPDTFDLDRPNASKHLSLGLGIHYCLGAPLASLEAECLIDALLDRFPRFERGPTPVQAQTATLLTYGLTQLPIVFHTEV